MAVMRWLREADSFAITTRGDERDHTVEVELRTPEQIKQARTEVQAASSMQTGTVLGQQVSLGRKRICIVLQRMRVNECRTKQ